MKKKVGGGEVNLISFTMTTNPKNPSLNQYEDATYQAEDGMTWIEWCESSYNTNGFSIIETGAGYRVQHNYDMFVANDSSSSIDATSLIENEGVYYYE